MLIWLAKLQVELHREADAVASLEAVLDLWKQNPAGRNSNGGPDCRGPQGLFPAAGGQPCVRQHHDSAHAVSISLERTICPCSREPRRASKSAIGVAEYWNLQGMSLAGAKPVSGGAIAALSKAIALEPTRPDLLFNLGGVYQASGDNEAGIRVSSNARLRARMMPPRRSLLWRSATSILAATTKRSAPAATSSNPIRISILLIF